MKLIIFSTFLFFSFSLCAQEKGVSPLSERSPLDKTQNSSLETGSTYAVVVGISDYQDPNIPDLRFADEDARAFANYLRSSAGGSLNEDHLKLLINQEATMAQFAMAMDWLWENVHEGDQAIIYFSGHGDVEKKSFTQPGFLLCWDAPAKVYMAGGAFSLTMLQEVITTLSLQNKAKVIVVTDACRSGKLSGSSINGAQATTANLQKQYANEIKILSCQPSEYSIEGEQWGGGRGAFSYHLVNGLYGMADNNSDLGVTLSEIDRYLEDNVVPEVAPINQVPMVVGNKLTKLAEVDLSLLEELRKGIDRQKANFTTIESKGIEDEVLSTVDSTIQDLYVAFKQTLKDKALLSPIDGNPENAYAELYYQKLTNEPTLERLYSTMRRNYAAALQENAQQFMNGILKSDVHYCAAENERILHELKVNIAYLERTIELLGKQHYMYNALMSFKQYFMGRLALRNPESDNHERASVALNYFRKALHFQPEMPQTWLSMAATFGVELSEYDSAHHYANLALDAVPEWLYAYIIMSKISHAQFGDEKALEWMDKAWQLDSSSMLTLTYFGEWHLSKGNDSLAAKYYKEATNQGTPVFCDYIYLGRYYKNKGQFELAEKMFLDAQALNFNNILVYLELRNLYSTMGDTNEEKIISLYKDKLKTDPDSNSISILLSDVLLDHNKFSEAEKYISSDIYVTTPEALQTAGQVFYSLGDMEKAQYYFDKFIESKEFKVNPYHDVGWHYYFHGHFNLAEKYYKSSIKFGRFRDNNPGHYAINYHDLAWLCFSYDHKEEAIDWLNQGLKNDPNSFHTAIVRSILAYYVYPKEKSYSLYEEIDAQSPGLIDLWKLQEQMKNNKFTEADNTYKSLEKKYQEWWFNFIKVFYFKMKIRQGDFAKAMDIMEDFESHYLNYYFMTHDDEILKLKSESRYQQFLQHWFPEKFYRK